MMADVITKNNNGRYKEEKKRNRRVSDPRVSTINGNQINGHVLVNININSVLQYKKLSIGAWLSVVDCRLMAKSETLNFNIFKAIQWIVLKFHRAMFLTMLILISSF